MLHILRRSFSCNFACRHSVCFFSLHLHFVVSDNGDVRTLHRESVSSPPAIVNPSLSPLSRRVVGSSRLLSAACFCILNTLLLSFSVLFALSYVPRESPFEEKKRVQRVDGTRGTGALHSNSFVYLCPRLNDVSFIPSSRFPLLCRCGG